MKTKWLKADEKNDCKIIKMDFAEISPSLCIKRACCFDLFYLPYRPQSTGFVLVTFLQWAAS